MTNTRCQDDPSENIKTKSNFVILHWFYLHLPFFPYIIFSSLLLNPTLALNL